MERANGDPVALHPLISQSSTVRGSAGNSSPTAADEDTIEPMALASVALAAVAHSDLANARRLTLRIYASLLSRNG